MSKTGRKIRNRLFYFLIPLVKIIGKITLPYTKKDPMINFYIIKKLLRPMDIILTTSYGHLSNLFNPGKFKHALAYIGEEKGIPVIIESIGEGVVKKTLVECLSTKDVIAILRPKKNVISSNSQVNKAIRWLENQVGKPYDFVFDMNSQKRFKNFFCSELIYFSIKHVNPETEFVLMNTFGVPTVTPADFYRAHNKFQLIYETKKSAG
jgi:hypothetical protein